MVKKGMVKKIKLSTPNPSSTPRARLKEPRSPQSGEEVLSARVRFKGALQELLQHSEDDTDSSDDEVGHWHSRSKRYSNVQKKQVEKQSEQEQSGFKQAFVMKLYDRSVDLAQFTEDTPLYPICRAWIANQPHQAHFIPKKKSPSPEPKEDPEPFNLPENDSECDVIKDVHKLPPPDSPMYGGNTLRIPQVLPYHTKYSKFEQDGVDPPNREQLLADNLSHWTKVRQKWLSASAKNEARYKSSFRILLAIFNKASCNEDC